MSEPRTLCVILTAAIAAAVIAVPGLPGRIQPPARDEAPGRPVQPEVPEDEADEAETEVILTDGRHVTGVLLDRTDREVILRIGGIPTPFPADTVAQVKTGPTVLERYREMRKTIADSDVSQRLRLAEWLRARRRYQLAYQEVTGVLALEPAHPEARQLHLWLTEQLKLVPRPRVAPAPPPQPPQPNVDPAAPAIPPPTKPVFPLLTPEQINLIRIYEVDLNDPPRMLVDRDAITELITRYATDPAIPDTREGRDALYRKRPSQILELLFQLKARELYGRVQVQEDPASMRLFRDLVHSTWLMNACSTTHCHGGMDAGRLALASKKPGADATVYTNFLILERFPLSPRAGDAPGAPARRLIDYDDPSKSPLLHLALPRQDSLYPHPQVTIAGRLRGFSPVFQSTEDRRFQDSVRWIRSMYRPRPDYPVQYDPPVLPSAPKQPAKQEADPKRPSGER